MDGDEIGVFICNNKKMLTLVLFDILYQVIAEDNNNNPRAEL